VNWKKFRSLPLEEKIEDMCFILGLDLGNAASAIAYYDISSNRSEVIDVSGGYGKPITPTVMQYIPATKEWVFGEYAILNRGVGNEVTVTDIIRRLGKRGFIEAGGKAQSIANILALYIKELISNCKNLDPKAEIAGIIVSAPDFCAQDAIDELRLAFKIAGYDKELIDIVPERLCVFGKYISEGVIEQSRVAVIDFGARSLRGGLYDVSSGEFDITLKNLSFIDDTGISTEITDTAAEELFTEIYESVRGAGVNTDGRIREQIKSFAYQHKDLLFRKNAPLKPIKLYFNFSHPPFAHSLTKDAADEFVMPYIKGFKTFLDSLFEKNLYDLNENLTPESVDTVLLTGGGFEMPWAKTAVSDYFPNANILHKNSKAAIAQGAAVIAANSLGVANVPYLRFEDRLRLKYDFGIMAQINGKEKFIPLVERSNVWWRNTFTMRVLINEETDGEFIIPFFKRDDMGDITKITDLTLTNLPKTPRAACFYNLALSFEGYNDAVLTITDGGFGELFEQTGYERVFRFRC